MSSVHRTRIAASTMCGQIWMLAERVTVVDHDITCPGCLDAMRAANVEIILLGEPYLAPFYVLPEDRDV